MDRLQVLTKNLELVGNCVGFTFRGRCRADAEIVVDRLVIGIDVEKGIAGV